MPVAEKYEDQIDCLIKLSKSYNLDHISYELESEISKIRNEYLYLVVIGQFKRGKSTLINALIGCDLLPTALLPLTSIITMLKFGVKQEIKIIFENDIVKYIPQHELFNYITESGNPKNEKKVKLVEILFPSEFLKDGIVLIDTPGIGSLFLHNTKSTESFIPKIDAAIFVLSVDPPITQTEFQFLEEVKSGTDKFYFVLNKIDMADEASRQEIITYTENILSSANHKIAARLYPVSAKFALEGRLCKDISKLSSSGILFFENEIRNSIKSEKFSILQNSAKRKIGLYLSQLLFSLELEQKALCTPVDIFEEKIEKFNNEMNKISEQKKLALYNFNGEINELITSLWDEINEFSKSYSKNLYKNVAAYLKSAGEAASKKNLDLLAREYFATKLSLDFEEWRLIIEAKLVKKFSFIVVQSSGKINALSKNVAEIAAGLFDLTSPLQIENLTFDTTTNFLYKTKDDLLFLEIDVYKILPYLLPKKILINLILKKMKNEIAEKAGVNSGSIMGFYRSSIDEASLKLRFEMDETVVRIIDYINTVVSSAQNSKRLSEQNISSKLKKITADLSLLNSIKLNLNEYHG
jgi:GTPase Era involved in 16S rRNA processing